MTIYKLIHVLSMHGPITHMLGTKSKKVKGLLHCSVSGIRRRKRRGT